MAGEVARCQIAIFIDSICTIAIDITAVGNARGYHATGWLTSRATLCNRLGGDNSPNPAGQHRRQCSKDLKLHSLHRWCMPKHSSARAKDQTRVSSETAVPKVVR